VRAAERFEVCLVLPYYWFEVRQFCTCRPSTRLPTILPLACLILSLSKHTDADPWPMLEQSKYMREILIEKTGHHCLEQMGL
jgi:hypothetical protein